MQCNICKKETVDLVGIRSEGETLMVCSSCRESGLKVKKPEYSVRKMETPVPKEASTSPFKEAKEELISAFEHEYLKRLLKRSDGRIAPAAREAGLNRKYFYDLLRKHGLHGRDS